MAEKAAVDVISAYAAEIGRRGGKARLTKMTSEQRREVARRAAHARWGKKQEAPQPPDPKGPDRDQQGAESGIMLTGRRPPVTASSHRSSGRSLAAAA